ncbi:MAG TPA: 23S rRNA (adenine(2503)-C(2))-methyltransferase RlmN [Bacteroidales bacterium]|nr:23S rRNA (adenine(2503)-C(2))-methyltransferase RlmN [Bacteroidales bacterium]HOR81228.1 23S rRNA (adenine(2503)-C(2))-methyltransferase RlmN [Bacteroidales bacterium]HPJ90495.1 23S rRNA (adenine(2503)-C(2))-methyltransferase RlmN [Bacteroidales bacterium]
MNDIRTLNIEQLSEWVVARFEKSFRAKQIYEWVWKKNVASFDKMINLPLSLREALKNEFSLHKLTLADKQQSADKSIKYGFVLADNHLIETVLIPSNNRTTVCVSSQVGCGLGCHFCATAKLGFKRNLSDYEMYEQIFIANEESKQHFGHPISNIVWMGMGEPLLNYENVIKAINHITSPSGLGMSKDRITLSTSGITEGIRHLADDNIRIHLAISLHVADNELRTALMPINTTNPLPQLSEALKYYYQKTKLRISIEYLLLNNINDSIEDAQLLANFCKNFPVKINLIEYNSHAYAAYKKSNKEKVQSFIDFLERKNLIVNLRLSKGKDIAAACGQLANEKQINDKI